MIEEHIWIISSPTYFCCARVWRKKRNERKIHGNPISLRSMELHFLHPNSSIGGGRGSVRSSRRKIVIDECVVHMLPPAIKSANAIVLIYDSLGRSFIFGPKIEFRRTHTHWMAALAQRHFCRHTIYSRFFLFACAIFVGFISNSTLVVHFVEKCQQLMDNVLFLDTYALETHAHTKFAHTFDTSPNKCVESLNANDVFNAKSSIKIRWNSSK